jgi:hypothetical protein
MNAPVAFSFRGTHPDRLTFLIRGGGYKERVTSSFDFSKFTLIAGSKLGSSTSLRCDHCRGNLGFRVQHYWRMRFCSANCATAYQKRLSARTQAKMRALSDEIKDPQAQPMMLKLANDYDKLADRTEDRAARDTAPGPSPLLKTKGTAI